MPSLMSLLKRRNSLDRAGNFDHQVFAAHGFPQSARFLDGFLSSYARGRAKLRGSRSRRGASIYVNGAKDIRRLLNIVNRQLFVDALRVEIVALGKLLQFLRVVRAAGDGLFENGGIGGHAAQAIFINKAREFARGEKIAPDIVEPDGLPERRAVPLADS